MIFGNIIRKLFQENIEKKGKNTSLPSKKISVEKWRFFVTKSSMERERASIENIMEMEELSFSLNDLRNEKKITAEFVFEPQLQRLWRGWT